MKKTGLFSTTEDFTLVKQERELARPKNWGEVKLL